MDPRERIKTLKGRLGELAKKSADDLTEANITEIDALAAELDPLEARVEKQEKSSALLARLGGAPAVPGMGDGSGSKAHSAAGDPWAKAVTADLHAAAGAYGLKNLLQGQINTPPAVEVAALPAVPTRLLDLLPREALDANTFSFLRQVVAQSNAGVVADGQLKPTSVYTFEEVEDRARVVAHLGEPFPLRYISDYTSMVEVLGTQMRGGVLSALEAQVVAGDGTGENFTGLLNMTGVLDVTFTGDVLTTLRRAVTVLQGKNEAPTAWVLNPTDAESIQLTREEGTTGGFLFGSQYAQGAVFGGVSQVVVSPAVPAGIALLADWRQFRLGVREAENTLAATQAGDLFETNRVKLRTEGRYGFKALRPQAAAVVHLSGDVVVRAN